MRQLCHTAIPGRVGEVVCTVRNKRHRSKAPESVLHIYVVPGERLNSVPAAAQNGAALHDRVVRLPLPRGAGGVFIKGLKLSLCRAVVSSMLQNTRIDARRVDDPIARHVPAFDAVGCLVLYG